MIDLVLAGDNAIVIGLAAAGLPEGQRKKAILIGILAATVLRIGFASVTVQLLQIIGLLLAGGVLLLWVCWKMWRELHASHQQPKMQSLRRQARWMHLPGAIKRRWAKRYGKSPSLTSRCRWTTCSLSPARRASIRRILIFGLALSIALMGFAANFIARLLEKHRWVVVRRPSDHPLCSCRHVLPRRAGGLAPPQRVAFAPTFKQALIGFGESAPNSRQCNARGMPWLRPF